MEAWMLNALLWNGVEPPPLSPDAQCYGGCCQSPYRNRRFWSKWKRRAIDAEITIANMQRRSDEDYAMRIKVSQYKQIIDAKRASLKKEPTT